jgi:uncharacterized protein (TIGR03086 family)
MGWLQSVTSSRDASAAPLVGTPLRRHPLLPMTVGSSKSSLHCARTGSEAAASFSRMRLPPGASASLPVSLIVMVVTFAQQRQDYFDALAWVSERMTETKARQLDARTPCEDFDVRRLMGHLLGTAHRGLGTAQRVSTRHIPHVITDVPDAALAATYATLATSIRQAWSQVIAADQLTAPWGLCTALEAARGFTVETVTHGWDLAVATGQPSDAPKGIAERCLVYAASVIPDRLRGVMYSDPIVSAEDCSATEQLAHLLGHKRDGHA